MPSVVDTIQFHKSPFQLDEEDEPIFMVKRRSTGGFGEESNMDNVENPDEPSTPTYDQKAV